MVYIPEDFLIDVNNMNKVHDILSLLDEDLVTEDRKDEVLEKLNNLGETKIVEKLKDGFFSFGA